MKGSRLHGIEMSFTLNVPFNCISNIQRLRDLIFPQLVFFICKSIIGRITFFNVNEASSTCLTFSRDSKTISFSSWFSISKSHRLHDWLLPNLKNRNITGSRLDDWQSPRSQNWYHFQIIPFRFRAEAV